MTLAAPVAPPKAPLPAPPHGFSRTTTAVPAAPKAPLRAPPHGAPDASIAKSLWMSTPMPDAMTNPVSPPPLGTATASVQKPHAISGCAAGQHCQMPDTKVTRTHSCPACGVNMHAICGTTNEGARSIKYTTTCSPCVGKFGRAFSSPEEFGMLQCAAPPIISPEQAPLAPPVRQTAPVVPLVQLHDF